MIEAITSFAPCERPGCMQSVEYVETLRAQDGTFRPDPFGAALLCPRHAARHAAPTRTTAGKNIPRRNRAND